MKSGIKNGTKVTLTLSWNIAGDANDEYNFPHKLLLTNTQVSKLCKVLGNNSPANTKLLTIISSISNKRSYSWENVQIWFYNINNF